MSGRETTSRGGEPDLKRRRLLDAGGPVEDDETARRKMREAKVGEDRKITGFNPEDVVGLKFQCVGHPISYELSPMGYFCRWGDLPMVRWLYVNGADPRDENVGSYFAMLLAAASGEIEVCKWLYDHGAARDVRRMTRSLAGANRALFFTVDGPEFRDVSRWLILKGALCKDFQSGELDIDVMKKDLGGHYFCNPSSM